MSSQKPKSGNQPTKRIPDQANDGLDRPNKPYELPPHPGRKWRKFYCGILLLGLIASYFVMFGKVTIDNQSGKTIERLTVKVNDKVVRELKDMKPGDSIKIGYNHFGVKRMSIEAEHPQFHSTLNFTAKLIPRIKGSITDTGSFEFTSRRFSSMAQSSYYDATMDPQD